MMNVIKMKFTKNKMNKDDVSLIVKCLLWLLGVISIFHSIVINDFSYLILGAVFLTIGVSIKIIEIRKQKKSKKGIICQDMNL